MELLSINMLHLIIITLLGIHSTKAQAENEEGALTCNSMLEGDITKILSIDKPPSEDIRCPDPPITCLVTPKSFRLFGIAVIETSSGKINQFPVKTWKERTIEMMIDTQYLSIVPNFTAVYRYSLPITIITGNGEIHVNCRTSTDNAFTSSSPVSTPLPQSAECGTAKYVVLAVFISLIIYVLLTVAAIFLYRKVKAKRRMGNDKQVVSVAMRQANNSPLTLGNGYTSLDMLNIENSDVRHGLGEATYVAIKQAENEYDNSENGGTVPSSPGAYSYPYLDMSGGAKNKGSPQAKPGKISSQDSYEQNDGVPYEDVKPSQTSLGNKNDIYTPFKQ